MNPEYFFCGKCTYFLFEKIEHQPDRFFEKWEFWPECTILRRALMDDIRPENNYIKIESEKLMCCLSISQETENTVNE